MNILLVDRDKTRIETLRRLILKRLEFVFIRTIESLDIANQIFEKGKFDILICHYDGSNTTKAGQLSNFIQKSNVIIYSEKEDVLSTFRGRLPYAFLPCDDDFNTLLFKLIDSIKSRTDARSVYLYIGDGEIRRFDVSSIHYFKADGDYTHLCNGSDKTILVLKMLKDLYNDVRERGFIRIHRSYIVNSRYISSIKTKRCMLSNGIEIPISNTYWKQRNVLFDAWMK